MSFNQMKRDELYSLAVDNFGVDVVETANKQQIIAALAENGVTWEMASTFDQNAAAIEEAELEAKAPANVITTEALKAPVAKLTDPVQEADNDEYIRVPKGVDGRVVDNVFIPNHEEAPLLDEDYVRAGLYPAAELRARQAVARVESQPVSDVVLVKMERDNPRYEIRGYKFTRENPFSLVSNRDVDFVLTHNDGFKIATPSEAKEFYN